MAFVPQIIFVHVKSETSDGCDSAAVKLVLLVVHLQLGHIDEDCITEMAVRMKRSRQSTAALVQEVSPFVPSQQWVSLFFVFLLKWACCVHTG